MLIFTFSLAHRLAYWLPFELTRIQCAIRLSFSAWAQKKETPFGISLVLYAASVSRPSPLCPAVFRRVWFLSPSMGLFCLSLCHSDYNYLRFFCSSIFLRMNASIFS